MSSVCVTAVGFSFLGATSSPYSRSSNCLISCRAALRRLLRRAASSLRRDKVKRARNTGPALLIVPPSFISLFGQLRRPSDDPSSARGVMKWSCSFLLLGCFTVIPFKGGADTSLSLIKMIVLRSTHFKPSLWEYGGTRAQMSSQFQIFQSLFKSPLAATAVVANLPGVYPKK